MDDSNKSNKLFLTNGLLLSLTVLFIAAWLLPSMSSVQNIVLMSLPTHMFAETFSVIVSMLVFALVFSMGKNERSATPVILASGFLIIGLLDFAHTLSYAGMPDFVTPGSTEKSIYFWLVARYVAAIALLTVAIQQWKKPAFRISRHAAITTSLLVTALFYWIGLYHLDVTPRTFIAGQGLTPFKIAAEYGIIATLLIPAILFYRQAKHAQEFDSHSLYAATVITILSELCFTLYANTTGLFIFMGHIYKVIAYVYIFRAIFIFVVQQPYQKLSESEQYNRTLFETASIGLAVTKMDGSLIDINSSYADIVGRTIEETKKLTYWDITPEKYGAQEKLQIINLNTKKAYGPYEKEYIHKDGHLVPVRLSGKLIERNGEPLVWSSIEDITDEVQAERARHESELHFRQLAEHIREVFWLTDINEQKMIYISPAYEKIWGKSRESLYTDSSSFIDAVHPDDRDQVLEYIEKQKYEPSITEYRIILPDGSLRWIKDQSFPIQNEEGIIYRVAGIAEDITEERFSHELLEQRVTERTERLQRKEEELIAAKDEAERANLAKTNFLSRMSHELRTPLNAILGFSQVLQLDETLNQNQRDSIEEIYFGGKHLLELINEVLDLARIESGNYELSLNQVDLAAIVKECRTLSAPMGKQYQVALTVTTNDLVDTVVIADTTRLKQIVLNLLSNAYKYNRPGGKIDIKYSYTETGKIRLSVTDTGKGISKDQLNDIYEPFNRLGAEYDAIEGTGIGLTITRQLVEMMGGSIGVESKPDIGSTFWIDLLPGTANSSQKNIQINTEPTDETTSAPNTNTTVTPFTILYIEDKPANLRLVEKIIAQCPEYNLISAMEPEHGIELACQQRPDLILLDINLPGMTGYEVLEILRSSSKTKDIPVIAVTANAMNNDIEKGRAAGFKDYLTKPISVEKFLQVLRMHLQ